MKKTQFLTAFILSLWLCTCESLSTADIAKDPVISLNSVELTERAFTGVDGLCKITVENPYSAAIPFPHIEWELFIADAKLTTGAIESDASIKSKSAVIADVPFHVDYADLYAAIASVKDASKNGAKETGFKIVLTAAFNLPVLGEKKLPLEVEGTMPLLQAPRFSGMALSIGKIDFTGITLNCNVDVENPNAFEIPFPNIDWDYSVNNNSFVKGGVERAAPVAALSVSPVAIQVDVKYADLYDLFQSLLAAGEAEGVLTLVSDLAAIPAFAGETLTLNLAGKLPLPKPPSIRFTGITVRNVNIFEGLLAGNSKIDFTIGFEIENKNSFAINLDSLSYTLAVNGSEWMSGNAPNKTAINANQKAVIPINATINTLTLIREIGALVASRKANVPYVCEGGVTITAAAFPCLDPLVLPFSLTGVTRF
ncbi:MAG: LEA type 2 family protein [Treponema sp.]|jgi:LEA14-like dessication related protein|nr:LEA type 2 family protein [Treponema sp.]